jgi:MFS family permease
MANARPDQKKKTFLFVGGLLFALILLGLFVYFYDKAPWLSPLHRSPLAGPLEIAVILVGLGMVSLVGALGLTRPWKKQSKSFAYDVGVRLVVTGYLMAFISALADYIGVGAHHKLPYFGPLQTAGVILGEAVIAIGFLMMFPYQGNE